MDEQSLKRFLEVSNYGSITRASKELYFTSQTLLSSMRSLEEDLGVKLLNRSPKGSSLTPCGAGIVSLVQDILDAMTALREYVSAFPETQPREKRLQIGMSSNILEKIRMRDMPGCETIEEYDHDLYTPLICAPGDGLLALEKHLIDGLVFATLSANHYRSHFKDLVFDNVRSVSLMVVVSAQDNLAEKSSISLGDLEGKPFITLTNNTYQKLMLQQKIAESGVYLSYASDKDQGNPWCTVENNRARMLVHATLSGCASHPSCVFVPFDQASSLTLDVLFVYHQEKYSGAFDALKNSLRTLCRDVVT